MNYEPTISHSNQLTLVPDCANAAPIRSVYQRLQPIRPEVVLHVRVGPPICASLQPIMLPVAHDSIVHILFPDHSLVLC